MNEMLASKQFKEIVVPLCSVAISILIKVISRKDNFIAVRWDDFNFGFDLLVSSSVLLVTYSSKLAYDLNTGNIKNEELCISKLQMFPYIIGTFLLILFALSSFVRVWGWRRNRVNELRIIPGIVIPGICGVLSLLWTTNFIE